MRPFMVGDTVRLKTGRKPLRVMRIMPSGKSLRACYLNDGPNENDDTYWRDWRSSDDYTHWDNPDNVSHWAPLVIFPSTDEPAQNQENTNMQKLYEVNNPKSEEERFGTLLATNSAGKLVLEMKKTGNVLAFDTTEVKEVRPYTVRLRALPGNYRSPPQEDPEVHAVMKEGAVAKGDLLVLGPNLLVQVIELDTKCDHAKTFNDVRKLVTEPVEE